MLYGEGWAVSIFKFHLVKGKEHVPLLQSLFLEAAHITSPTFYCKDSISSPQIVERRLESESLSKQLCAQLQPHPVETKGEWIREDSKEPPPRDVFVLSISSTSII